MNTANSDAHWLDTWANTCRTVLQLAVRALAYKGMQHSFIIIIIQCKQ